MAEWPALFWPRKPDPLPELESPIVMSISRNMSRFIARLLVGVLVFAQAALSAYACPVMPAGSMGDMEPGAMLGEQSRPGLGIDGMPAGSWRLDSAQPNLCAAHCQSGQQNVDGKSAPAVQSALPASLYPIVASALLAEAAPTLAGVGHPPPAVSPPLAILHCCFRI